jgi:DNA polymerase III subunit delta'
MNYILISKELSKLDNDAILYEISRVLKDKDSKFLITNPKESKYKINEIKLWSEKLWRKSVDDGKKIVHVLLKAETLSPICQNALLKVLEETKHIIILVSDNISPILPTVISRCQVVNLELNIVENEINESVNIDFNNVPEVAKLGRDSVKKILQSMLNQSDLDNYENILLISTAVKKVDANCKIESVLYELAYKTSRHIK